ncbi:MAG TPA: hypothetical protein VFO38_06105 [Candidatus Saccharimonadales bacterium]|nr:hypothetical protein [Candidatus Saccharimonadales bacterium]
MNIIVQIIGWGVALSGVIEGSRSLLEAVRRRWLPTEVPSHLYAALAYCLGVGVGLGLTGLEMAWAPPILASAGLPLALASFVCRMTYIASQASCAQDYPAIRIRFCRYRQGTLATGVLVAVGIQVTAAIVADSNLALRTSSFFQFSWWGVGAGLVATAVAYWLWEVEKRLWAGGLTRRFGDVWFSNYVEARMRVDKLHFSAP